MTDEPKKPRKGEITIKRVAHVLELLVRDLYGGDPHLTLRELIQNAHDALVELGDRLPDHEKAICIRVNVFEPPYYIEVADNGIGMTPQEIEDNLCSVGDSDKLSRAAANPAIIGRFGIGFLSSFIVADHVEVISRHMDSRTAFHWETKDKEHWDLVEMTAPPFDHGTRVRLFFRDSYPADYAERINDLRTTDGVESVVQRFCYLIRFALKVGRPDENGIRVNAAVPPWDTETDAMRAYEVLFSRDEPSYVHRFSHQDAATGFQSSGLIFFRDELSVAPSVQLYVKRILVDPEDRSLLPSYAPFVECIVECPDLSIDLSRRHFSKFDPVYKWLRSEVHREYRRAFVQFATRFPDKFIAFWPNVDNSVIGRLIGALAGSEEDRELAREFLLASARHIPFYLVDTVSGAQGRPLWRTIHGTIERWKREEPNETEKVAIRYTDSMNPIEKDMLLSKHKELFDVGRAEKKSHEGLMALIMAHNDQFDDFEVVKVQASRFDPVSSEERVIWEGVLNHVSRGLTFYQRRHEVVVERFQPNGMPVVLTDSNVDPEAVAEVRTKLQPLAAVEGEQGAVFARLSDMLDQMGRAGGVITIHLNANHDLLGELREATNATDDIVAVTALDGIMTICWRAVLDYFGWNSTRDMITKDRTSTHQIISQLLVATKSLAAARGNEDESKGRVEALEEELAAYREQEHKRDAETMAQEEGERVDSFVGFIDMVGSTQKIIANPDVSPEEAARYMKLVTDAVEGHIAAFGTAVSFTGDGLLFCFGAEASGKHVIMHLRGIRHILRKLQEKSKEMRMLHEKAGVDVPELRIAVSYGPVFRGRVGPTVNLIGPAVVQAARICEIKDLYKKHEVLVSKVAYNRGAGLEMWSAADLRTAGKIKLRGLGGDCEVFSTVD